MSCPPVVGFNLREERERRPSVVCLRAFEKAPSGRAGKDLVESEV